MAAIAFGRKEAIQDVYLELGIKAIGREVTGEDGIYELRERNVSYNAIFARENTGLRPENTYFWNVSDLNFNSLTWSDPVAGNPLKLIA